MWLKVFENAARHELSSSHLFDNVNIQCSRAPTPAAETKVPPEPAQIPDG
jgi:hypothetical protein